MDFDLPQLTIGLIFRVASSLKNNTIANTENSGKMLISAFLGAEKEDS